MCAFIRKKKKKYFSGKKYGLTLSEDTFQKRKNLENIGHFHASKISKLGFSVIFNGALNCLFDELEFWASF